MYKFICALAIVLSINTLAFGQDEDSTPSDVPNFFLGFSTGINNYAGLFSITGEYAFAKPVSVYGGLGIGTWGTKTSIGLRYYLDYPQEWSFNVSYSHCSGLDELEIDMEEEFVEGQSGKEKVDFKLKSINTVNLSATKHWMIGKRKVNRIHLEIGYAIPTATERYDTSVELTSKGKTFMRMMEPGGIIIGTGITFGLRN